MLQHIQMSHTHTRPERSRPKPAKNLKTLGKSYAQQHRQGKGQLRMIRGRGNCLNGLFEGRFRAETLTPEDHRRPETVDCRP